jgi:orotidine-5'-phosphate decarboxylase
MVSARERLIVALDVSSSSEARMIVATLGESVQIYKVGMQLYTAEGPPIVRDLIASGRDVFLDLKYHDIPNTVGAAVTEASQLGVRMLTVHAAGGSKMLRAAVEAARNRTLQVLAVTVLTSMETADLTEIGVPGQMVDQVTNLASIALESGCAGLVSSARELPNLRQKFGSEFVAVIPGVRPAGSVRGDQARVVTPAEAISAGATHLVVGRPITAAPNPVAAVESILAETAAIPVA